MNRANKYGSTAPAVVWENAERVRKFKYEQQMKASRAQAYGLLIFTACLIGVIAYNIIGGLLG